MAESVMKMTEDAKTKENLDQQIVQYLEELEKKKKQLQHTYSEEMKDEELKAAAEIEGSQQGPLGAVRIVLLF